ncbi:MAG: AAA family ATPase, partial [bacterium]
MKRLPIGIQTFETLITDDLLYIDKTELIFKLISQNKYYFLSRPRRFGKSLLLSTLKEIFLGNKDLFKGLFIYDKIEWEKYPVIHIDLSNVVYNDTIEKFQQSFIAELNYIAKKYNVEIKNPINHSYAFNELIKELSVQNKVVILIDEYDKPIVDFITNKKKAAINRDLLRDFYSVIKANDQYIKFAFLTGVSKFSKVSLFSGLNNLKDITMSTEFSTICGYTQEELEYYFNNRFEDTAKTFGYSVEKLKADIKLWYNGYSWDGINKVYNPYSILNFFQ